MNEEVIISKIKNGDRNQLAIVYRTYRSEFIAWICSHFQCSRDEARDVYQVSIMVLYHNIVNDKLQQLKSSIKTYLFAIGKNKFLELKKAESRFSNTVDPGDIEIEEVAGWEHEEKELKLELVAKGLDILGEPCKTLLELFYFHDMSMDAIADQLSYKNRATAKNLKYKCLNRLRNIFTEEMEKSEISIPIKPA